MSSFIGLIKLGLGAIGSFLRTNCRNILYSCAVFFVVIIFIRIDLVSKDLMFKYVPLAEDGVTVQENPRVILFPGLALVNVYNTGTALGQFSNIPHGRIILSSIGIVLEAIILAMFFSSRFKIQKIGALLVFCGGFGNIYDRIKFGYVRDFIDMYISNYHWPSFNFADILVVLGATILIAYDIVSHSKHRKP